MNLTKLSLVFILSIFYVTSYSQDAFITTWKTDNAGSSCSKCITIPTTGPGYNYSVDWDNDGTYDQTGIVGNVTHTYASAGTYKIRIKGAFPRIFFNDAGDKRKLLSIDQWGPILWKSMEKAFKGCLNMTYKATDKPDLTMVGSLASMFSYCDKFNGDLSGWNTTNITDMSFLFEACYEFDQPLSSWNTSNVTTTESMFYAAFKFNQLIGDWDVSKVSSMKNMFYNTQKFNSPLDKWNTISVVDMTSMFESSDLFNQPIGGWNTKKVTKMGEMFASTKLFNQEIESWDVSNVTAMYYMFFNALSFNKPLNKWKVGNVDDNIGLFFNASAFNQPLHSWTLNSSSTLTDFFSNCGMDCSNYSSTLIGWASRTSTPFNQKISAAGIQYAKIAIDARNALKNKGWVFTGDTPSNDDCDRSSFITTWKTDNTGLSCPSCIRIPAVGSNFKYDVDWDNDGVFDQKGLTSSTEHNYSTPGTYTLRIRGAFTEIYFQNADDRSKLISIDQWGILTYTKLIGAFANCSNVTCKAVDAPDLSLATTLKNMFNYCFAFNGDISHWDVSNVTDISGMFVENRIFNKPLNKWNTSKVTDMTSVFSNAKVFNQPLDQWNTSNVTKMENMFSSASAFNQPLSSWNTSKVINMTGMFLQTDKFDQPLNTWNVSNVTTMAKMFNSAYEFNQPLNTWNISKVVNMSEMFLQAFKFNQPLDSWNVSNVTNMADMFYSASDFNQLLNTWNTSKVVNMSGMFFQARKFDQPLDMWNVSSVTEMSNTFKSATSFNQSLGNWKLNSAVVLSDFIFDAPIDCENYSNTLIGWANNPTTPTGKTLNATNKEYKTSAEDERNILTSSKNWTIIGDKKLNGACNPEMRPFITSWKTDNPGTSCPSCITIPTNSGYQYNYDIDWNNDGLFDEFNLTGDATHDYGSIGTYIAALRGNFPSFFMNDSGDKLKLLSVNQWGDVNWSNMNNAFHGCTNLQLTATDVPDFSSVFFLISTFEGCSKFNENIENWDVSKVFNMRNLFSDAFAFNQPLDKWNTSKVVYMVGTFNNAKSFNQPIENWDVSNVIDMSEMFNSAISFNQPIGKWKTSKVENMRSIFNNASTFNQIINSWDVSKVLDFSYIFGSAIAFNKSLDSWKLNDNSDLSYMFTNSYIDCENLSSTLKGWSQNQNIPTNRILGAEFLKVNTDGQLAVDFLKNSKGWTINGATLDPNCTSSTDDDYFSKFDFSINPNPAKISAEIKLVKSNVNSGFQIFDLHGRLVLEIDSNVVNFVLDSPGIYFIKETQTGKAQKLIIIN